MTRANGGGAMTLGAGPIVVLRLTRAQQMALANIVLTYSLLTNEPQEFYDVLGDHVTTTPELLCIVTDPARWGLKE